MVVTGAFGPFGGGLLGSVSGGLDSALCRPSWSMPALARGRHASASASPSLGPGNGILRAETGGGFQAQNAGEWPEFCSQTALRPSAPPMCATREAICVRRSPLRRPPPTLPRQCARQCALERQARAMAADGLAPSRSNLPHHCRSAASSAFVGAGSDHAASLVCVSRRSGARAEPIDPRIAPR